MASIWDPQTRATIDRRLAALPEQGSPRWGSLTAARLLCHLADQIRVALAQLPSTRLLQGRFERWPLRWLGIYLIPIPRNTPGPPEMFSTQPTTWSADLATLYALLDEAERRRPGDAWGDNPFFGATTKAEWGVLIFRHFDHHLRQFGVET